LTLRWLKSWLPRGAVALLVALLLSMSIVAQGVKDRRRRVPLPEPSSLQSPLFFADAFQEGLVGTRPPRENLGAVGHADSARLTEATSRTGGSDGGSDGGVTAKTGGGWAWSQLISRSTLEDEIKRLQITMGEHLGTPTKFTGGGYKLARADFSLVATLFAVIAQYDQEVRWQEQAATARDLFARAAANMKVSSTQAFNEARQRKGDLEEMVRGGRIAINADAQADDWDGVVDRQPLMQYLEQTNQLVLLPAVSSSRAFAEQRDKLRQKAEMFAMLGQVLAVPGMEDAADDDYAAICRELTETARAVVQAVSTDDYNAARHASGEMSKACDKCHKLYRE